MTSDKQRREVAAELRSMKPEETTAPFGKPVLMHIFRSVFPNQMFLTNWILRLPFQLADLIDRPTCVTIEHGRPKESHVCKSCSRCSYGWFECIHDKPYSYCPNCGAEVVDDAV